MAGTRTLFMVSAGEAFDRVRQHLAALDAAVEVGVERIVYLSFVGAAPEATFTFARDHWHTEEHVRSTGVSHTFLRDNMYLDYFPALAGTDGVIRGSAGDGRVGAVARDDIAEVAVAVLLGEGHDGRTYDVTGPEAVTLYQAAEDLTRVIGRSITYHAETLEEGYASRLLRCARMGGRRLGELLRSDSAQRDEHGERHGLRADRSHADNVDRLLAKVPRELQAFGLAHNLWEESSGSESNLKAYFREHLLHALRWNRPIIRCVVLPWVASSLKRRRRRLQETMAVTATRQQSSPQNP